MQTRRSFIAQLATAAAASTLAAPFVRASSPSSAPQAKTNPVIGTGAFTYECVHDWLIPPEGMVWGDTHGLCQDSQGYIYVAHTVHSSSKRPEAVVVFDPSGKFVRAFGSEFRAGAHGLDVRHEAGTELLYHCDTARSRVVKTSLNGDVLWSHGYPNEDPAYSGAPINYNPDQCRLCPQWRFLRGRRLRFASHAEIFRERRISLRDRATRQRRRPD